MSREAPVAAYLGRLRRRAALLHGVRALVAALGAGLLVFGLAALVAGPVAAPALVISAWLFVALAVAAVGFRAWRAFRPLRGAGAARLLAVVSPSLPSAARSAVELSLERGELSPSLILAHQARVREALARIEPRQVVPLRWLRHRAVALGAAGIALGALILTTERGGAGAYALVHPGARTETGQRIAVAFSGVEAHLVYPGYLARPSLTVADPTRLEVPRGTSIELRARARLDADAAVMRIGERDVPMERDASGTFVGRFVAREDGALSLRMRREDGEWIHDAAARSVRAIPDEAPRVTLLRPAEDRVVDGHETFDVQWDASDDVGIDHVDLVLRTPDGRESRRRVGSYREDARPTVAAGEAPLDLALLGVRPGDSVRLWLEARDGDIVSGPNLGRSAEITITLASEATRRSEALAELEAVLDRALHLLADRIERPVPQEAGAARARLEALTEPTEDFVDALRGEAERIRGRDGRGSDVALYREMARRVRLLLAEERRAHGARLASYDARKRIDERTIAELEDDVLTLDALVGRARVEDAAAIARELESLRREIHSLLAELTRTQSAEARTELLAAIGRAQARMRELMERIARMGTSVPQEFMNAGELPTGESADTLAQLSEAVQRGDFSLADRLVNELSRQIDQLARALGHTEQSFVEARFGERERALAEALDALAGLEAEQAQLSRQSVERRRRAAERALEAAGLDDQREARRLAERARAVRRTLEQIDPARLPGFEQDAHDRARQRLIDTEDALRTGDLGEARRMAEAAAADLAGLSRDLGLSALMFPGHEGQTSRDAKSARDAERSMRELRRELDEALPDVASHLSAPERAEMRQDAERQRAARNAADRLASQFDRGPEETPLDPEAATELREAAREMRAAQQALERGEPLESARHQEEAARRLTELRERLEQDSQGGGGGGSGESQPDFRRPVEIPDADAFEGPMERRRRLLDAMREAPPRGYEDAVRRYYEGLLR